MAQIAQQRPGHLPQTPGMPMHFGATSQSHVQQKARLAWKGMGQMQSSAGADHAGAPFWGDVFALFKLLP